jgi:hypothetical protein
VSGNGRQLHQVGIIATSDLVIQRIDGGCMDLDQDLARLRHRLGYVTKFERFRAAKGFQYDRFHCNPQFYNKGVSGHH